MFCMIRSSIRTEQFGIKLCLCLLATAFLSPGHGLAQEPAVQSAGVLRQAKVLLAEHRTDEAAHVLDNFLSTHTDDADALTMLAQIRLQQGDSSTAKDLLTRALASSPNSPSANLTLGKLLLDQHRDPEAMDRFETVLDIDLRDAEARRGELAAATDLAMSARREDRPDAALKVLEHARTKLPDDPQLLLDLGVQAMELRNISEATDALEAARKLDGDNPEILYALARVEMTQLHLQPAEADLRAYLAKRPEDASAHFGLGRVLEAQQKRAEAKAEFERSVQLQPAQTESYYELGQLELEVQHDAQAAPLFEKVLSRDPHHGGALTGMGIIAFRAKNYAQAEQYLAQAENAAPNYQPAHYYRGLVLDRLGRKDESHRELQTASALDRQQQGPPGAVNEVPAAGTPAPHLR